AFSCSSVSAVDMRRPTVAIGGISLERAPAVLETGVGSIAVVSAITQAADWQTATARLLQLAGAGDERS
ncbi:MAG: thiamine phosphate synthase, partial [Enterobacter sp.]|nr:thiamine phosphate synthase [Enterobacter sp.]